MICNHLPHAFDFRFLFSFEIPSVSPTSAWSTSAPSPDPLSIEASEIFLLFEVLTGLSPSSCCSITYENCIHYTECNRLAFSFLYSLAVQHAFILILYNFSKQTKNLNTICFYNVFI